MRHARKSQGFTLVELLVVLAILSTVMGISVTLMFTMFDFQQRYAEQNTGHWPLATGHSEEEGGEE